MSGLDIIYSELKEDLDFVQKIIDSCKPKDQEILSVYNHIAANRGKMIRPIFIILFGMLNGIEKDENLYRLAASVEMIHLASLIHDDVIDNATTRRGSESIASRFGNKIAILSGDMMLSKSMIVLSKINQPDIIGEICNSASELVTGEIIQIKQSSNLNISLNEYLRIIKKKTASLFIGGIKSAFILSNKKTDVNIDIANEIGLLVGIIFQVVDDMMDYISDGSSGKGKYADFREKKVTIPVIKIMEIATEEEKNRIFEIFKNKDTVDNVDYLTTLIEKYDIMNSIRNNELRNYLSAAQNNLNNFHESRAKEMINEVISFLISRNH